MQESTGNVEGLGCLVRQIWLNHREERTHKFAPFPSAPSQPTHSLIYSSTMPTSSSRTCPWFAAAFVSLAALLVNAPSQGIDDEVSTHFV